MVKICNHDTCTKTALFNLEGEKYGIVCGTHKTEQMINICSHKCHHTNCLKRPIYNIEGQPPHFCFDHKTDGMCRIGKNVCIEKGCDIVCTLNFIGEKRALYCKNHAKDGMISFIGRCIFEGCNTRASFNTRGVKSPLYCYEHKQTEMIDVRSKSCLFEGCDTKPTFNIIDKTVGIYCVKHKLPLMINVNSKNCVFEGCNTRATFNTRGLKDPLYCAEHKQTEMIDVRSKRCLFEGCDTQPKFNTQGHTVGIYCTKHKLPMMFDVTSKWCIFEGCRKQPNFNIIGQAIGIYCAQHKSSPMVNVKSKHCKTHLCYTAPNPKYEGYCFRCFVHTFPEKPISRNYKTKERDIVDRIKEKFGDFDWIADSKVQDGCSKRRPDLFLDLGFQVIIIEIDEYAHDTYEDICENKRIMEISQDIGHSPIMLIRFNPDSYTNSTGEKIQSCWAINKSGLMTVKKNQEEQWKNRIDTLMNQIQFCVDNPTEKTIEKIELFY